MEKVVYFSYPLSHGKFHSYSCRPFRLSNVENGVRFDETLTLCEDWGFRLQMLEYGQFRLLPETTAIYRMELSQSGAWENAALSQQMSTIIYRK